MTRAEETWRGDASSRLATTIVERATRNLEAGLHELIAHVGLTVAKFMAFYEVLKRMPPTRRGSRSPTRPPRRPQDPRPGGGP